MLKSRTSRARVDLLDVRQTASFQNLDDTTKINGLQQGLHHLQLEIDRKLEELKDLVIMINTTKDGPKRESLKKRGNSSTVIIMSLRELYKSLEVSDGNWIKPEVPNALIYNRIC